MIRNRIPRICACGIETGPGELCPCEHEGKKRRGAKHDLIRPTASQRGYSYQWRKARELFLLDNPYCAECAKHGINRPATVVDHIIAHKGDPVLFWTRENWQPLCENCHNSIKQRLERSTNLTQ
nr:HNH endonuclease signature motif containing protein [uncultured Cohaesibacter sp.]